MKVNKEIEVVKNNIQELIGIDISNLATLGDLSNLEDSLKQYTDNSIPNLSNYATKEYVNTNEPDLSSCLAKTDMFYEGDPTNEIRIKYNSNPDDGYNQKNNIYVGENYTGTTLIYDYQSVVIGYGSKNTRYKNVLIGNHTQNTLSYSTVVGFGAFVKGSYGTTIGCYAKGYANSIAIGAYCNNNTTNYIKFWTGNDYTTSSLTGVQFGNIIFGVSGNNLTMKNATSFDIRPTFKSGLSASINNNDIVTKEYADTAISSISAENYILKSEMYYEGDSTKDLRIKYQTSEAYS
jgi:hypothetical protein